MLRRNFPVLVVCSQILALGITVVQYLTESLLPPELLGYLNNHATILVPDRYSVVELLTDIPFVIQTLLGLLAAVGLLLFRPWGRPVFLIYLASELIISLLTGPYVNTGGSVFVGYLCSLTEGAILALIYFSPIRKMFRPLNEIDNPEA